MSLEDRLSLTREAYERAIARARVAPTRESWMRLMRAHDNVVEATKALRLRDALQPRVQR